VITGSISFRVRVKKIIILQEAWMATTSCDTPTQKAALENATVIGAGAFQDSVRGTPPQVARLKYVVRVTSGTLPSTGGALLLDRPRGHGSLMVFGLDRMRLVICASRRDRASAACRMIRKYGDALVVESSRFEILT
jgi:hypothetical protein